MNLHLHSGRAQPGSGRHICDRTSFELHGAHKGALLFGHACEQSLSVALGCSSCPPANANLIRVREQPGVLGLSFGVTYWDRLGWKDVFGRQDYTVRQATYEKPLGESGAFTW